MTFFLLSVFWKFDVNLGTPKPVYVPDACAVPCIMDLAIRFNTKAEDTVLLSSPLHFDPSIVHIFLAFSRGAKLLVLSQESLLIPNDLCYFVQTNNVSILQGL